MKKLLTSLIILTSSLAYADNTATSKPVSVIIPNTSSSGLAMSFIALQKFASKKQITLTPVFKPGAQGKIGIDHATKSSDALLLATTSDIVQHGAVAKFDPVSNISEVKMVMVASNNSNIKHIDDILSKPVDKFNWVYSSASQLHLIKTVADHVNLDKSKMQLIAYNPGAGIPIQTSLVAGDADIGFVSYATVKRLVDAKQLTLVDTDSALKKRLSTKVNAISLFLPKNSNKDTNKFWQDFIEDFLEDNEVKENLKAGGFTALPTGKDNVVKVLESWTN